MIRVVGIVVPTRIVCQIFYGEVDPEEPFGAVPGEIEPREKNGIEIPRRAEELVDRLEIVASALDQCVRLRGPVVGETGDKECEVARHADDLRGAPVTGDGSDSKSKTRRART